MAIPGQILEFERRSGPWPWPEAIDVLRPGQAGERQDDGGSDQTYEAIPARNGDRWPQQRATSGPDATQALISRAVMVYLKLSGS